MIDWIGIIAAATGLGGVPDDPTIIRRVEPCPIDKDGSMGDSPLAGSIFKAVNVTATHHEIFARFGLGEGRPSCQANPMDGREIRFDKRNCAVAGSMIVEVDLDVANLVVRQLKFLEHAYDYVTKACRSSFRSSRMHCCAWMEATAKCSFIKSVDSPRVALEHIFDVRTDQQIGHCR
jgi:hypothetical protein